MRPLTSGAMPIRFAKTSASSVCGFCSTSRQTARPAVAAPKIMSKPRTRPTIARADRGFGDEVATFLSSRSVMKSHHPNQTSEQPSKAEIYERTQSQLLIQMSPDQCESRNHCQDHSACQTKHPYGKKRTEDVDRGRTGASAQRERAEQRGRRDQAFVPLHKLQC